MDEEEVPAGPRSGRPLLLLLWSSSALPAAPDSSMSSTLGLRCCWSSEAGVLGATGAGRAAAMDVWAAVDRRRRAKRGRSLMGLTSPVGADVSEAAAVADRLWLAEVASP